MGGEEWKRGEGAEVGWEGEGRGVGGCGASGDCSCSGE